MPKYSYGCIRGEKDDRDFKFHPQAQPRLLLTREIPSKFDLRNFYNIPDIQSQGSIGSCTAHGVGFCYYFNEIKQGTQSEFQPSRLFIYYNTRKLENRIDQDSGCVIRNVLKSVNTDGVCEETLWPYDTSKFKEQPPANAYAESSSCKTTVYRAVDQDLGSLKAALHDGYPIVFGFNVYDSFKSLKTNITGVMHMPDTNEQVISGHCVCIIGYDDNYSFGNGVTGAFIIRNSWGFAWGNGGYFYMPYNFATDPKMAYDFWIIEAVTDPALDLTPLKWYQKIYKFAAPWICFIKSY